MSTTQNQRRFILFLHAQDTSGKIHMGNYTLVLADGRKFDESAIEYARKDFAVKMTELSINNRTMTPPTQLPSSNVTMQFAIELE